MQKNVSCSINGLSICHPQWSRDAQEKYDPLDSRRMYTNTIMSIEEANSGKKSIWDGLEITGMSRSKPSARYFTLTSLLQWKWNIIKKEERDIVYVSGNVRSLSSGLWSLTHLTALHLSDNSLSRIPPEIAKLHNLVFLDLSSNKIRSLPAELGNMVSLRWLGAKAALFFPYIICSILCGVIREWKKGILKLGFPSLISMLQMSITIIALKLLYVSSIFI